MKFKALIQAVAISLALVSCSSNKSVLPYFTDLTADDSGTLPLNEHNTTIVPEDELLITVMSEEPAATAMYNLPLANPAMRDDLTGNRTPTFQTYIVNKDGDITMPVLGKIHVEGMTVDQLTNHISQLVSTDVENPMVRVELMSFRVVVAGEVNSPRTVYVHRNRYTILDALSDAGDLTQYGRRENVLVIREENGQRTYARLNLNSSDIFNSPYFYVKQNDYIYVEPNDIRQANSRYNQDNSYKLTVISTVVSAASVVASLVIALTVK